VLRGDAKASTADEAATEWQRVPVAWTTTARLAEMKNYCESEKINKEFEEVIEVALANYTGPTLERKGNRNTAEFLLDETKAKILELEPAYDPTSPRFRTAVVLMAATFVIGPNVDLLVKFTGYPKTDVADIARRMRASDLWSEDEVDSDDWFYGNKIWDLYFQLHCLVAEGLIRAYRNADGQILYDAIRSKPN
jgi:hypothetical protein